MQEHGAEQGSQEAVPFFPDHVTRELRVVALVLLGVVLVGLWASTQDVRIGDPADPQVTPLHCKPEWYFLALYQVLKFVPKSIGALVAPIIVLAIAALPFIDRRADRTPLPRRARLVLGLASLLAIVALTLWGMVD